ncbi:Geranylgeranyl transferase type-1 subunit beta [Golovinomyces cichoracearum]|uniref:Geranylgeranyl transferase type-1 subunit beta n=1 Tax=Golovinomyces cichoracearum TaxID=62708 RepID=A0A420HBP5_9PEZI|nr:Geranylgeranyl transferase type-1 subunit beta [Golovinomyces cichoracearum]
MEGRKFDKETHIRYWQRCLKSLLPTHYTSTDSSRMTLGFFILSALDLLGEGAQNLSHVERTRIRDWILKCQHPNGGFCGSPNHRFPDKYYVDSGGKSTCDIDPANLPATYFAVLSLGLLGDLRGIQRKKCLRWLRSLQREDGSFGELVTSEGIIWGGRDMRYCYVATALRWILMGDKERSEDINTERLVSHLRSAQTFDGGISESSQHEAHAGYTYCAIASLSFLDRLPSLTETPANRMSGILNVSDTLRWLVSRQVACQTFDKEEVDKDEETGCKSRRSSQDQVNPNCEINQTVEDFIGFNGRCNKRVDTCYTFWVTASLKLLCKEELDLVNSLSARKFLREQTQHRIGGFGKCPGDPPDIYHSYLGLAALALNKEPDLKQLDPALCVSVEQKYKIASLRDHLLVPSRLYWKNGYCFLIREDDPEFEEIYPQTSESEKKINNSPDVQKLSLS